MDEKEPLPTLHYRGLASPTWVPTFYSPLGMVVSYAVGCAIGFCAG